MSGICECMSNSPCLTCSTDRMVCHGVCDMKKFYDKAHPTFEVKHEGPHGNKTTGNTVSINTQTSSTTTNL